MLIKEVPLVNPINEVETALKETDELIRIFVASIRAAEKKKP